MFIKPLENLVLNVFFLLKTFSNVKTFRFIFGSLGIWSDKVSLLHIKVTQRGGEHGDECRQSHGGTDGAQSDGDVACGILITFETNALGIRR